MRMGLRLRQLGTQALSWGDLWDCCKYGNQDTALALERYGPDVLWRLDHHLLASVLDALHGANWQRGGGKGRRPKPIKRPGAEGDSKTLGSGAIPVSEFEDWWNKE